MRLTMRVASTGRRTPFSTMLAGEQDHLHRRGQLRLHIKRPPLHSGGYIQGNFLSDEICIIEFHAKSKYTFQKIFIF